MTLASASPDLHFSSLDSASGRRMSPPAIALAILCNAAIVLLLLLLRAHPGLLPIPAPQVFLNAPMELPPPPLKRNAGDSGGASPGLAPPSLGNPPPPAPEQLSAPKIAVDDAKLAVVPTITSTGTMARVDLSALGMPDAPSVGASLGNHPGTGIGTSGGPNAGGGHNTGDIRHPGGSVSKPEVLYAPEPQFSEDARRAKVGGNVLVYLVVDASGRPTHVHVLRGLGLGLDEKALEAVLQYKFKPAMENGHPVPVEMNVDVNFQIF